MNISIKDIDGMRPASKRLTILMQGPEKVMFVLKEIK